MVEPEEFEDDLTYNPEEIDKFVQDTAEEVLTGETWDEVKVPMLIN